MTNYLRLSCGPLIFLLATATFAQTFTNVPLDSQLVPLELNMGELGPPGTKSDLLVVQLWNNTFNDNRLTAYRIPAPYDGTGVTSQDFDSGSLFGINLCMVGENQAVVVYTKDLSTVVADYDGSTWSTGVLPATIADDFHYADCAITSSGILIQGLNASRNRLDVFRRSQFPVRQAQRGSFNEFVFAFSLGTEVIPGGPLSPFFGGIPPQANTSMNVLDPTTATNTYSVLVKAASDTHRRTGLADASTGQVSFQTIVVGSNRGGDSGEDTGSSESKSTARSTSGLELFLDDAGPVTGGPAQRRWLALTSGGASLVYRITQSGPPDVVNLGSSGAGLYVRNRLFEGLDGNMYALARRAFAINKGTLIFEEITGYPFSGGGGLGEVRLKGFNTTVLAGNSGGVALSIFRPDFGFASDFE